MTQESIQIDGEMPTITDQCQELKNQMEVWIDFDQGRNDSMSFLATSSPI